MTKSAAEVEREVEASRNNLDRTVEALKEKMTPGQLFDQISNSLGSTGNEMVGKLAQQARENPMPVALMGIGLAWLMMGDKSGGSAGRTPTSYSPNLDARLNGSDGEGSAAGKVAEKIQHSVGKIGEAASFGREHVAHAASGATEKISRLASGASETAAGVSDKARQTFSRTLESEPLLIGALGLVVGVAIAASLPSTPMEDKVLGPMRDKVADAGKDMAKQQLETAQEVATGAYAAVKEEVQRQAGGEGSGDLAGSAAEVARAGVQAAREQLPGDGATTQAPVGHPS